ncbi:MAG: VRR-NUC domain-containing protein [Aliifodinibius sp.]|nr:VRR-NUC domain-containing protein [Fodinibius sp.]
MGIIFSVPNEGIRSPGMVVRLKSLGMLPGVSDIIVVLPGKILFIELKLNTGQSKHQKKFQIDIEKLGYFYAVVKSLDQFKAIVEMARPGTV